MERRSLDSTYNLNKYTSPLEFNLNIPFHIDNNGTQLLYTNFLLRTMDNNSLNCYDKKTQGST